MAILKLGLLALAAMASATKSSKRGLVFVTNDDHPEDYQVWSKPGSDLTWYYNYDFLPSPAYAGISQEQFEFIPMKFGVDTAHPNETSWLTGVQKIMDEGRNITHALGFNEPDAPFDWGGSNVDARNAAFSWVANFEPLAKKGVKLGLPACTGAPSGLVWLKDFLGNCSEIVSEGGPKKNCTWDFLPVHWYDNFGGLASHIGERRALWPNKDIWVTEYAYAHQDLAPTQEFYNQSADYLDRLDYIGRYSYFGAFRSDKANVGPNAAFLNKDGKLTDIGSWYLGFGATGVKPQSSAAGPNRHVIVGAAAAAGVAIAML